MVCGPLSAQDKTERIIEKQYVNEAHRTFMYQVSPQTKTSDLWLMEMERKSNDYLFENQIEMTELASDTSWSYSEYKAPGDTINTPQNYGQNFSVGTTASYTNYYNSYTWYPDSAKFYPERLQTSFRDSLKSDSTETYYFRYGESEPYIGYTYVYPKEPSEGADYESLRYLYYPETGWSKDSRSISFRNEFSQDTLRKDYRYVEAVMDYQLESLQRFQSTEDYYLSYYESYNLGESFNGGLYSIEKTERTPEYEMQERRYFSIEGEQNAGSLSYTKLGEDGSYLYQTTKVYSPDEMRYIPEDSLGFIYQNGGEIVEAMGYYWDDSVYVLDQAYTSFQSELSNGEFVADSIIVYSIVMNEETMEYEKGEVNIKTEMDYDEHGNQIEVRNFQRIGEELIMTSRTVREFKQLTNYNGDPYYTQVKQDTYTYDHVNQQMYLAGTTENKYDNDGTYLGNSYFNFSAAGDTTYGYTTQRDTLLDGSSVEIRFDWDLTEKELVIRNYRIWNRRIQGDQGQHFTQSNTVNFSNGMMSENRSMNVYTSYPGVFNDGPVYIEMGDTLIFYVSARNPDMSIPDVEVSNLPATAIFDPESRRFFWIVDDLDPGPMMYKATRGDKFVTAEVEFVSEQFTVSNEGTNEPQSFELTQNYPNPFNPSTNISFTIPASGDATLKVYNLLGQEVATLVNERMNAGSHTVNFDASRLASGIYIYRLTSGGFTQTRKMTLIK
jgi:hypothetical protein